MIVARSLLRMAAADTLKRLELRAKQADETIGYLKQQVEALKKHAVSSLADEEVRLEAENEQLKKDIENMKNKLIYLETQNGFKQVALPSAAVASAVSSGPSAPPAQAAPAKEAAKANDKQPNEKAKKKEGKPQKQKPKAADEPVDVSALDLRVGYIRSVKKHPDADTLYIEEIDCGEEKPRNVVSGLVKHYEISQMSERLVIVCCNLKPAKMRGVLSQAMVMCASSPEKVELLDPPEGSVIGDRVSFEGYAFGDYPPQMNPKKKIWERIQPDLQMSDAGVATYKGTPFKVEGKGVCTAPSMKNSGIK
ncbi:aminoacyl tRNA synthase complex-interacting multifunctional protein 1-like [Ptychodera flava]|uniref:aminoacyl tRNA synthase complex-interacting multifunctional protein 1-like n=1 Tax=Ptychodera flava TaxID=63121 RepID=UPI003969CA75